MASRTAAAVQRAAQVLERLIGAPDVPMQFAIHCGMGQPPQSPINLAMVAPSEATTIHHGRSIDEHYPSAN
jgi:hypothetical protein